MHQGESGASNFDTSFREPPVSHEDTWIRESAAVIMVLQCATCFINSLPLAVGVHGPLPMQRRRTVGMVFVGAREGRWGFANDYGIHFVIFLKKTHMEV